PSMIVNSIVSPVTLLRSTAPFTLRLKRAVSVNSTRLSVSILAVQVAVLIPLSDITKVTDSGIESKSAAAAQYFLELMAGSGSLQSEIATVSVTSGTLSARFFIVAVQETELPSIKFPEEH